MSDEWGPWIQHDGVSVPVIQGKFQYEGRGFPDENNAVFYLWLWYLAPIGMPGKGRILRYRLRKPRGLTILQGILSDIPAQQVDA